VSRIAGLCLVKKALPGCATRKLKKAKARASEAGTEDIKEPGNSGTPKQGETSTKTLKRSKSERNTPTEMARAPKRPRDLQGGADQHKDSYLQGNIS
jgi:hypothetical protein